MNGFIAEYSPNFHRKKFVWLKGSIVVGVVVWSHCSLVSRLLNKPYATYFSSQKFALPSFSPTCFPASKDVLTRTRERFDRLITLLLEQFSEPVNTWFFIRIYRIFTSDKNLIWTRIWFNHFIRRWRNDFIRFWGNWKFGFIISD